MPVRTEVELAWGTAAALVGEPEGTEAIRAALRGQLGVGDEIGLPDGVPADAGRGF